PLINPITLLGQLTTLSISAPSEADYFTFTAPAATTGTLTLTVQSSGLSLLRPAVSVYNSSLAQLASAAGSSDVGSTLSMNVKVSPGQKYYVVVSGADGTAWATGAYAVSLYFGSGSPPPLPLPNTVAVDGYPIVSGGGSPIRPATGEHGDPAG